MTVVVWADSAKLQLRSIYNYIAQNSEQYALQVVDRITMRTADLSDYPMMGEMVPEYGFEQIREIVEPHTASSMKFNPTESKSSQSCMGARILGCRVGQAQCALQ